MKRHESRGAVRLKAIGTGDVRNHRINEDGYFADGEFGSFSFRGERDRRSGVHVHVTGLSLNTAQEFLDKNYRGKKVVGIRSCSPPLDRKGDVGSIILVKTSV